MATADAVPDTPPPGVTLIPQFHLPLPCRRGDQFMIVQKSYHSRRLGGASMRGRELAMSALVAALLR
ncbi:hypothetical protein [Chelatococcus asaccharovorans]|uniref:hypothetical protein n=1 Tax=Chelatococcus asaccharovorans TaxID=28210 RepID=UPI00226483FC|nr:hypothetical protein [Chelatococcus asaccharovorans]